MAQYPAMPLWTDAYLADTRHLSPEQHGAYLLLLMEAWRRPSCSLPDDDGMLARLAGMSGERWAENRETVMSFWKFDGRRKEWTQLRLTDERSYVDQKSRSQRDKAASRWKGRKKDDAAAMPERMPEACPDDAPTPTPTLREDTNVSSMSEPAVADGQAKPGKGSRKNAYTAEFEDFWKRYPATVGQSKLNGFKAWQRLTSAEQGAAAGSLPAYAALLAKKPDRPVKHVQGYLSGKMFESFGITASADVTRDDWTRRLKHARQNRVWAPAEWGPAPGTPGCRVPPDLLVIGDGLNWRDWK